jgi:hypothetical protein
MQANSFFLRRAVARPAAWQLRYPAFVLASATDLMDEPRKQIIVAAADQDCIRMVFFSSLGSVLDLHTTWDDLARARQWLDFTLRWNRWWLPDAPTLETLTRLTREPSDPGLRTDTFVDASWTTPRSANTSTLSKPHIDGKLRSRKRSFLPMTSSQALSFYDLPTKPVTTFK